MSMITNLTKHKNKKKYEKIVRELSAILKVLSLTQQGLTLFKHYVAVQEIISVLETNKTLMELQLKKYEKELKEING